MNPIPYGKQTITDDDIKAVVDALTSEFLTQGPKILEFEKAFAKYVGATYAVAVANGTAALHLCAMALNTQPGDQVITTPITFAASANCVKYCGGDILFADIEPNSFLIDLEKVKELLEKDATKKIKGIIPVDFAGNPVNLEKLREIADAHGCWIIEDACHAPGGYFVDKNGNKQLCGNGKFAELAIFSFHPVKHIATAEGGMITTNSKELYDRLMILRTHGITKREDLMTENHGAWYYQMLELGFNYRLTDVQAALGISQLSRADEGLQRRKEIAAVYDVLLKSLSEHIALPFYPEGHAFHLYVIRVKNNKRKELYDYLREQKIYAQIHYIPVHTMPYYQSLGHKNGDHPIAEHYYNECISLPMFPSLTHAEQEYVVNTIKKFFNS